MSRENSWKRSSSAFCPLCKTHHETITHVFQCNHNLMKLNRMKAIANFKSSLIKSKTSPILVNHLHRIIQQHCGGFNVSDLDPNSVLASNEHLKLISYVLQEQKNKIGIENMMFGILSKKFCDCQRMYFKTNNFGRNYTIERWGR